MHAFLQDLQYGFRLLLRSRSVTLIAVLSIALGIGVNATVFSWVDSVLLHPLPGVANQNEVVVLKSVTPEGDTIDSSYPDYRDLRDKSTLFAGVIATKMRPFNMGETGSAERVWAETVTGNYFDVLGVKPILGRTFNADEQDERVGAHPVVILSERLWRRTFNSDPAVIGRSILINRRPLTVIGVVPGEFRGTMNGLNFDLWMPLTMRPVLAGEGNWLENRRSRPLAIYARLKPGVSLEQARAEISAISQRLGEQFPDSNRGIGAKALTLWDNPDGATSLLRVLLQVLLGVGAVVLLIVCANVGNLLLARAISRRKEFAIRIGLGARTNRLARQLLTESFLLALLGALAGLLVAVWLTDSIDRFLPPADMPVGIHARINSTVLGWTAALAILTTLLCGVAPALHAARPDVNETLKAGSRGNSNSGVSNWLRNSLVVAEVALAVVALVGAGLFLKSFQNARAFNPGFDPTRILLAGLDLSTNNYSRDQNLNLIHRATQTLEALPGVKEVSVSEDVPLGLSGRSWEDISVEGYVPRTGENMKVWRNLVMPKYFKTLGIPLIDGREFTTLDTRDSQPVMVVNQTFVKRFLGGGNAIGRKVRAWGRDFTVSGVAKDGKYLTLSENQLPYFYLPLEQVYSPSMGLAVQVRTEGQPAQFANTVRRSLLSLDPGVSVSVVLPMNEFMEGAYFAHRIGASLLTVLGIVSLILSAIGLYGVMSYTIGQRTHEIGIRMALGARPLDVLKAVIGRGLALALLGIGCGLLLSTVVTRVASRLLFQVSATDPLTFGAVSLFLAFTAFAASYMPARRATRIDPMQALHGD